MESLERGIQSGISLETQMQHRRLNRQARFFSDNTDFALLFVQYSFFDCRVLAVLVYLTLISLQQ